MNNEVMIIIGLFGILVVGIVIIAMIPRKVEIEGLPGGWANSCDKGKLDLNTNTLYAYCNPTGQYSSQKANYTSYTSLKNASDCQDIQNEKGNLVCVKNK